MNITLINGTNDTTTSTLKKTWTTILANSTSQPSIKISTAPLVFLSSSSLATSSSLLTRLKLTNYTTFHNQSTAFIKGFRQNLKHLCNCERSLPFSNKIYAQNENIWKLAFFALAFIVGLVSMMLILTFSTKIIL